MKNIKAIILYVFILLLVSFSNAQAQGVSDYLILQDIGSYKFITQTKNPLTKEIKTIPGYTVRGGPGILGGAKHFGLDHTDITYETEYESEVTDLGIDVQVTQHSGSDSDKWLLHEVEDGYRDGEMERLGLVTQGARLRDINGNKIISLRGSGYSWISNNAVIEISYTDLDGTKPEPLEIIQAYLQKFPSTIPATLVLDQAHNEIWIKDEMDRRLWLGDKWFIQTGVEQNKVLREVVDHLYVFLNYREKYYGIKALEEKQALWEYLQAKNETEIKTKLAEYKTWWEENKDKPINL